MISTAVAAATTLTVIFVAYFAFPVTGLQVEGARMYPQSYAWNAVPDHASLLTLNEEVLEQRVESNPWVKGARVSKNWESGIVTVEVEERRPVLYAEVDGRRVIASADGEELPGLGGAGLGRVELDRDQVQEILGFGTVLSRSGVRLDSVDGAGPQGIETTVEGREVVFSGAIGEGQARALSEIMRRHPEAGTFDLRSPARVVVAGSPGSEPRG
ncbi:MAG: cell division protein FtsQ/DivIB [Rubrobacter sp.]